jgi:hypothetical protein
MRIAYTRFNVAAALAIVLPGMLYFGVVSLLGAAAARRALAGYMLGTTLLLISLTAPQIEPVSLSTFTARASMAAKGRLLGDESWLLAKTFFVGMAVVLTFFLVRIVGRSTRPWRPALGAALVLFGSYAGLHYLWMREPPRPPVSSPSTILNMRETDNTLRLRMADTALTTRKTQEARRTLVTEVRFRRNGNQWVRESSSMFYPVSEVEIRHLDLDAQVAPGLGTLQATARMTMKAINGPLYSIFFRLAWDLQVDSLRVNGTSVNYQKHGDLVETPLPAPVQAGDEFEVALRYAGPLLPLVQSPGEGMAKDFILLLYHWHPTVRDDTQDWVDPFTGRATVRLPKDWRMAAAARVKEESGQAVYEWESRIPVHYIPLCIGQYREFTALDGNLPVSVCAFHLGESHARRILARATEILRFHEKYFGPYPYPRLAMVENRFQDSGGTAFPSLITFDARRMTPEQEPFLYDLGLPHEIAHFWWSGSVPKWIAEGMAVYANFHYLEETRGRSAATQFMDDSNYQAFIEANLSMAPLLTEHHPLTFYARGGYLLMMLQSQGDKRALLNVLRGYYERHREDSLPDEEALNRDFEETLQQVAGQERKAFVTDWMRSTKRFDPALVSIAQETTAQGFNVTLNLEQKGELQFPVPIRLEFTDGSSRTITWEGRAARQTLALQYQQPIKFAQLDPEHMLLDWNRANNRAARLAAARLAQPAERPAITRWKTFTKEDGLSGDGVRCLLFGRDRRLYAGFSTKGFVDFKAWNLDFFDGQWHRLIPDAQKGLNIFCLAQAKDGTLWAGGDMSLWRLRRDEAHQWILQELRNGRVGKASFKPNPDSNSAIPGFTVFVLFLDAQDNLWAGTDRGVSVLEVRTDHWSHFSERDGLPGQAVFALAQDSEGVIWAGTSGGVASCKDGHWIAHPSFARNDLVLAVATDTQRTIWFGTYRNGIVALRNGKLQRFTSRTSALPHDLVSSLACDTSGRLWAGTAAGLVCYDGKAWRLFDRKNSGLPSNHIQRLVLDDEGCLWIGTDIGVTRYEP